MRLWAAYSEIVDRRDGKVTKSDGFKCCHCGGYQQVKPFQIDFTRCWNCDDGMGGGLICDKPACHQECIHFMKALEISEAQDRFRRLIDQNADYT